MLVWRPWFVGLYLETLIREPWYLCAILTWLLTLGLTKTLIHWEEVLDHHIMHHQSSSELIDHGNHSFDPYVYMLGISSDSRFCSRIHTCAFHLAIPNPLILSIWCFQVHRSMVIDSWFIIALVLDLVVHYFFIVPLWFMVHCSLLTLDSSICLTFNSCDAFMIFMVQVF